MDALKHCSESPTPNRNVHACNFSPASTPGDLIGDEAFAKRSFGKCVPKRKLCLGTQFRETLFRQQPCGSDGDLRSLAGAGQRPAQSCGRAIRETSARDRGSRTIYGIPDPRYRIPVDEYLRRCEENLGEYDDMKAMIASGRGFDVEPTNELASNIIHSMVTGTRRVEYVNVRNGGLISSLPGECCVEVPALVDRGGVRPIVVGALPSQCAALNRTFLNVVELTVRAALEERRDLVYQAALLDPAAAATLSIDEIVRVCDELVDAHGELIPAGIRGGSLVAFAVCLRASAI